MIHKRTHPEYVEGCYGCKLTTVTLFDVDTDTPKRNSAVRYRKSARQIKRDVESYERAKKAGLNPETSTRAGVEKAEKQAESEARALKKLGASSKEEVLANAKADWKPYGSE